MVVGGGAQEKKRFRLMHHTRIDYMACGDTPIHRVDGRTKLLATVAFTVFAISQGPMSISRVACLGVWPFSMLVLGGIRLRFAIRQILVVSPFVAVLALSSLLYDRSEVEVLFGPLRFVTSGGALRCAGILAKFVVTMGALIALVGTTRFSDLLNSMARLGMPKVLVMQLGFLYRYIFLLIDRGHHMLMARNRRKLRNLGIRKEVRTAAAMVGSLCMSSFDTAERINRSMQARGFDGEYHRLSEMRFGRADVIYAVALGVFLAAMCLLMGGF